MRGACKRPNASRTLREALAGEMSCPTDVGFAKDIRPLFNATDVGHMKAGGIDLSSYGQVKIYAHLIYEVLSSGEMPPPPQSPWPPEQVNLFLCWIQQGKKP